MVRGHRRSHMSRGHRKTHMVRGHRKTHMVREGAIWEGIKRRIEPYGQGPKEDQTIWSGAMGGHGLLIWTMCTWSKEYLIGSQPESFASCSHFPV